MSRIPSHELPSSPSVALFAWLGVVRDDLDARRVIELQDIGEEIHANVMQRLEVARRGGTLGDLTAQLGAAEANLRLANTTLAEQSEIIAARDAQLDVANKNVSEGIAHARALDEKIKALEAELASQKAWRADIVEKLRGLIPTFEIIKTLSRLM